MTGAQLNHELLGDAVIKPNYLFETLNKIGLEKRFEAQLRLWINTGNVTVSDDTVSDPVGNATGYNLTPANNTFSNTCPIMINYAAGASGIVPVNITQIVAGLYIVRPPTTSFTGINLAASVLAHPLPNCRLYYSQVTVEPQKSIDYVQRNRNKKLFIDLL